jgi:exodeoxyribonuclease V alpha subunit
MEQLRCVVERITYQNEENGYSVIKVRAKGFSDLVSAVGNMPEVHVGSVLVLGGSWSVNPKYGRQFNIQTFEETLPATAFGIEKYLGSGLVKGIGPKFANRIVKQFGKDTLQVIEVEPDRLLEVPGIGQTRVDRIKASWTQQKEIKNIMLFLQGHDVSTAHATKIYKAYGNDSIKIVQENPYRMADDIWGIGFRTADTIAKKMGFGHDKYVRLRSGLIYTLNRLADEGHCYATRSMLISSGAQLLSVDEDVLHMTLDEMIKNRDVITEQIPKKDASANPRQSSAAASSALASASKPAPMAGSPRQLTSAATASSALPATAKLTQSTAAKLTQSTAAKLTQSATAKLTQSTAAKLTQSAAARLSSYKNAAEKIEDALTAAEEFAIYLPPFYFSEIGVTKRLLKIYSTPSALRLNPLGLSERIKLRTGMTYDSVQLEAIRMAVSSKILVLTGGPGTGKTTTTLGIISAFREARAKILLAAPTGRAAKRLSEATGMEAKTIHRLLEAKPPEGYQKNEENPLEGDVLIVDECSMIDIMLMYNLLKAIPDEMILIMVGDIDQLPSVGPGNVLRDVIASGHFPVVRLTRIFRQAQTSRIIMNAHRINAGHMPDLSNGPDSDFFFTEKEDPEEAASTIIDFVKTKLPRYYHVKPADIQVLTPMQRGNIGAANLNQLLQSALNPYPEGLHRGGYIYKPNDKVMQIRNNYDKEVFNGDIGVVETVDMEERELMVRFDDRLVPYDVSELDELVLAYATTIHKSQGSEYPIVVMPVLMSHYVMLQRNLIYTGITRAKKILVIVGTKKALSVAIGNVTVSRRNTLLKERLAGLTSKSPVDLPNCGL